MRLSSIIRFFAARRRQNIGNTCRILWDFPILHNSVFRFKCFSKKTCGILCFLSKINPSSAFFALQHLKKRLCSSAVGQSRRPHPAAEENAQKSAPSGALSVCDITVRWQQYCRRFPRGEFCPAPRGGLYDTRNTAEAAPASADRYAAPKRSAVFPSLCPP